MIIFFPKYLQSNHSFDSLVSAVFCSDYQNKMAQSFLSFHHEYTREAGSKAHYMTTLFEENARQLVIVEAE